MPNVVTRIQGHEVKSGTGARGPWTLNIFKASDGDTYQTFDRELAGDALSLLGRTVSLSYSETERPGKDGQVFINRVIESVVPTGDETPTLVPPEQIQAPVSGSAVDDRQVMIMRQSALSRAIDAFSCADLDPVADGGRLLELAESYIDYFVNGYGSTTADESEGPVI